MKKYELTCATLDIILLIKSELKYPIILIFQGNEVEITSSKNLDSEIENFKLFCSDKLIGLIEGTRKDLLK